MGSKSERPGQGQSEFLGAAADGDMSDACLPREDERRDALDAERDEAWRYKSM